jgi:5-methylcytosine-specific restriction endonuclease McrA
MPTIFKPKKKRTWAKSTVNAKKRIAVYKNPMWLSLRNAQLTKEPLCAICSAKGITKLATDVHHWVWISEDINMAFREDNLVSVCSSCHGAIHSKTNALKRSSIYNDIDKRIRATLYGKEEEEYSF